ncbi:hypothetical protein PC117_g15522 [Phytophthora cactorum]|uniref:Uncharacterized protein n=1 Tax=Phytophthora cactorum TaxID=29920 RepID=A0A8T1CL25_9STRA|nr:hypothetical protein PC117_g15522 [Phytophthora cactorum]
MAKLVPMSNYKLDVKLTGGENYQEWNARIMTQFIATDMNKIVLVLKHFQVGMESCDPHVLWIVLRNEFRRGNVIETTSIFIDIYSRKVRKDEGVREYIDDLLDTRRVLCENGGRMGDCELARIMVCNVHMVYPSVTNYFTKDKERRVLEIKEAIMAKVSIVKCTVFSARARVETHVDARVDVDKAVEVPAKDKAGRT